MSTNVGEMVVQLGLNANGFSSGLTQSQVAVRNAARDMKQSFSEANYSTMEARHAISMLGEEIGVRIPRGVSMMLASLAPVGSSMAAAFPVFGAVALIGVMGKVIEKFTEMSKAAKALSDENKKFGAAEASIFEGMKEKLLEVGIKADELTGKHFAALKKELELIDLQSMKELGKTLEELGKISDDVFKQLDSKWYQFGKGSAGAKNALEQFQTSYQTLLAEGRGKEAGDLLAGTAASAHKALADMQAAHDAAENLTDENGNKLIMVGQDSKELEAQKQLVRVLDDQLAIQKQQTVLTGAQKNDATQKAIKAAQADTRKLIEDNQELARDVVKSMEAYVAFGKASREALSGGPKDEAGARATKETLEQFQEIVTAAKQASTEELAAAKESAAGQEQVNAAVAAQALAKIKEYQDAYKVTKKEALQEEITAENAALAQRIEAIKKGAAAEKQALQEQIDAAQRARAMSLQIPGVSQNDPKILAYNNQINELLAKQGAIGMKAQTDISVATTRTDTAVQKLNADIKLTENSWSEWARKSTEDVSSLAQITQTTSKEMQTELTAALSGFSNAIAKTIVEGKSLGKQMKEVAKDMAESFISASTQMLIKYIALKIGMAVADKSAGAAQAVATLAADKVKVASAAGVAGAAGVASWAGAPWPIDMGAPAFGAEMAATALAFGAAEKGGLVGYDDMIIAAHKNEMVLPAPLSQKVQDMTDPKRGGGNTYNMPIHYSPTVHAVDGKGIGQILNDHAHVIQAHVQKAIRRQNK